MQPQRVPAQALIQAMGQGRFPFWYPKGAEGLAVDYFVYGTDFLPLDAAATITNPINITNDSAFVILSAVMVETDTTNLIFLGQRPLAVQLFDSASGRQLSNTPIAADNWFGTAEEPKYWDIPKVLSPNTTFNVTLQNLDQTNDRNIHVAFHGFKIFGFTS